jgi:hypothetical protein
MKYLNMCWKYEGIQLNSHCHVLGFKWFENMFYQSPECGFVRPLFVLQPFIYFFIYFESPVSLSSKPTINKQTPHLYNPDSIYFIMTNKF